MSAIELIVALMILLPMILAAISLLLMALWSWIGGHVSFPRMAVKTRSRPTEEAYRERRGYILDFVAYVAITVLCLYLLWGTLGAGYPRGYLDATLAFYLAKIKMLLNKFSFYTPSWYFGYELLRFYPPLSTLIPYGLVRLTGNVELTYYAVSLAAYVVFCLGVYKFVREYTNSFPAGLYAGLVWAVVHANFVSFQGHYWETCRLFGTCVLPWTLLAVHRALDTGRRRDVVVSAALLAYAGLSSILSLIDIVVFLVPFVAVKAVSVVYSSRETLEKRFGRITRSTLLIGLGFLAMVAWWYVPAVLPYGVGRYFYGRGVPPGILDVLFSLRPPSYMPAVQLPVTVVGILGVLVVLLKREARGVTLLTFFALITGMVYVIQFQSVRFILLIGLSLTMLGGYFVANMPELFSKVTGGMLDEFIGRMDSYARSLFGRVGLSLGKGAGRILVLSLISLCVAAPIVAYYVSAYKSMAAVDNTVYGSDEYLTATWLWQRAGTSYRVYVMYGDHYRGSQWVNTFYPELMQVLGGYDQGALTDKPFVFDNLVKWGTDASELHEMAVKHHVKYIVVEKTWDKWTDETWSKFLYERYFRPVSEVNDRLVSAAVFEVLDVKPVPPSELQYRYVYWSIWRLLGLVASLILAAAYTWLIGLPITAVTRPPLKLRLPPIPAVSGIPIVGCLELLDLAVVAALTLAVEWAVGALTGFPKGLDAYGHLTKIRFILSFWPKHGWNHLWDAGTPLFSGSYPPLSYYMAALLVAVFRCRPESALTALAAVSLLLNSLCVYGFVKNVTGDRLPSLLAVSLMVFTPAYWEWWVYGGNYGRVVSLGFFGLSLYLASLSIDKPRSRLLKFLLPLTLAGAVCCHPVSGVVSILAVSVMLLLSAEELREGLTRVLKVLVFTAGLDAFYVTQLLFSNPTAKGILLGSRPQFPVPVGRLFAPTPSVSLPVFSLMPLLVPLLVCAVALSLLRGGFGKIFEGRVRSYVVCCGIVSILFLGYALIGHIPGYPNTMYVSGFMPASALCMASIGLSALVSIMLWQVLRSSFPRRFAGLALVALTASTVAVGSIVSLRAVGLSVVDETSPGRPEMMSMALIQVDPNELNYRLGTDSAFVSVWFSYLYGVPQSRGYYAQGTPYPDWHSWLEYAVWFSEGNYGETNFLLDWYAIRWIVVGYPHYKYQKFLQRPDLYKPVSNVDDWWEFEYLNASPILSATNVPSVLFIGSESNYDFFLRAMALSNFNSRHIIPVKGPSKYVDDYTLEELQKFDCVFLYGYNYRDVGEAFSLLKQYVEFGGSVFFEANNSPDYNSPSLPEPFPVNDTVAVSLGTEWDFTVAEDNITHGIDFSKFSPPVYDGAPWGFSTTTSVRWWAKPVVSTAGSPIMVSGTYGSGRVVWSGMNLVYHIVSYGNVEESELLKNVLLWLSGGSGPEPPYEVEFVNPQKRVVRVYEEARGILFKESYFRQWKAEASGAGGSVKLPVYMAGPGLMYVPLPEGLDFPLTVVLTYHKLFQERVGVLISILTLILLVTFRVGGLKKVRMSSFD